MQIKKLLCRPIPLTHMLDRRFSWQSWVYLAAVGLYLGLCTALYVWLARPSELGESSVRVGSDSTSYLAYAGVVSNPYFDYLNTSMPLVSFGGNFLGPVLLAKMFPSVDLLFVLNVILFLATLRIAAALPGVRPGIFFSLLILDAITTQSVITLNKEILSALGICLFFLYIQSPRRRKLLLIFALLVSFMARWEQAFISMMLLFVDRRGSFWRGRHVLIVLSVIACISVLYPLMINNPWTSIALMLQVGDVGTLFPKLNAIQAAGGFPLIVLPKIALNLWGRALQPGYFFTDWLHGDFSDMANFIAIPFHCIAMLAICMIIVIRKRLDLQKQSIYWVLLYLVISAMAPYFQPRYQYPVYVVLCLEIAGFESPVVSPGKPLLSYILNPAMIRWRADQSMNE